MSGWAPSSALGWAVWTAGFAYDPAQDIIVSRLDATQRSFGYAYGYDAAALGMSAVLHCEPIFFDYAGKHWMIELWKGQYGLETGCEIGVYTRAFDASGPGYALLDATVGRRPGDDLPAHSLFYDCAGDGDLLELSATLRRDGQVLFTRGPERHWWLTGFRWGVLSTPDQLSVDVAITLKDEAMRDAFLGGIAGRPYPGLRVDGTTVRFTFERPFARQPPAPNEVVAAVTAANRQVVDAYVARGFADNDPNHVQAAFLEVAGLALLRAGDHYGRLVAALGVAIGRDMGAVVGALTAAFGVDAAAVERWLSGAWRQFGAWVGAVEAFLGLPMDFSCYVEIDNTRGASDLVLAGRTNAHGDYAVAPPEWIPRGGVGRLVLQDPKPSVHGSEGTVTYRYGDSGLNVHAVDLRFECPTGFLPNRASASTGDWTVFATSSDPGGAWQRSVPRGGHPLFVAFVVGGGTPA
ncbi:DUF4474 domain-containing protein [Patulibacter sp. SYSU D01012]|uniref:DUF4474 domain-containing protein n=1 Tax=Patulibacter sp. SYSU D01012 TaxID=2817381 RepID=UPI001B316813